jgi:TctA family transporter
MTVFGIVGYGLTKLDCEPAPLLLGFVLGPMLEEYLRRAMLLANGNPLTFFQRPITAGLLIVAAVTLCAVLLPAIRNSRKVVFAEED